MNWLRYYTDTLDNPKIQDLPSDLFKFWINLLCLARLYNGVLPDEKVITFRLRTTQMETTSALHELEIRGLLDRTKGRQWVPHDWDQHQYVSDNVTDRVKKHRMKRKGNVSCNVTGNENETPPEQKQNRAEYRTEQNHPEIVANGNGAHPPDAAVEFPEVFAEIRKHDPGVNEVFVRRLMQDVVQKSLSNPKFPPSMLEHITDANVARCVAESYRSGPKQHGTGLLLSRVPDIVFTWSLED